MVGIHEVSVGLVLKNTVPLEKSRSFVTGGKRLKDDRWGIDEIDRGGNGRPISNI